MDMLYLFFLIVLEWLLLVWFLWCLGDILLFIIFGLFWIFLVFFGGYLFVGCKNSCCFVINLVGVFYIIGYSSLYYWLFLICVIMYVIVNRGEYSFLLWINKL